jgi:uncharacterized repeat protein (TIGR02543 family)
VSVSPNQDQYAEGTQVTITATPASGWSFANWSGDASGSANPLTVTMDDDKTITANFTEDEVFYTLTVNTSGQGSVSVSPNQDQYAEGTQVTITATPASGWSFANWSGDASGSANPLTVTMNSDKTITANFTEDEVFYTLTVNTSGQGSVSVSPNQDQYAEGTQVTITATPASGWSFANWSGDASGSANPLTVIMNSDKTITANFTEDDEEVFYTLTVNTSGQGSVSVSPNQDQYAEGTQVTITATPASGWSFANWSGDASGSANPLQ